MQVNVDCQGGEGRAGPIRGLRLTYIYSHVENRQLVGTCCIAQVVQLDAL